MTRERAVFVCVLGVLAGCGASAPEPAPPVEPSFGRAIAIEWKASQGDGDLVNVTLVVDGKPVELGTLAAATEMERGTPRTCALRAAHPLRTEFVCGELRAYYSAELQTGELVVTFVDEGARREVTRIPVVGEGLAVAPYALPD